MRKQNGFTPRIGQLILTCAIISQRRAVGGTPQIKGFHKRHISFSRSKRERGLYSFSVGVQTSYEANSSAHILFCPTVERKKFLVLEWGLFSRLTNKVASIECSYKGGSWICDSQKQRRRRFLAHSCDEYSISRAQTNRKKKIELISELLGWLVLHFELSKNHIFFSSSDPKIIYVDFFGGKLHAYGTKPHSTFSTELRSGEGT